MFPVGVILASLGYAVAYYGVAVLRWVHDPAHPHNQPPSLPFLLGASTQPAAKPFAAPVNTEGASNPFDPFGAGQGGSGGTAPATTSSSGQPAPSTTSGGGNWYDWLFTNVNPRAPGN